MIELLTAATGVAFDVDSTVCTDEGIDELAAFLGKGDEAGPGAQRMPAAARHVIHPL